MSRKLIALSLTATLMGGTAFAETPQLAVDIAPVHSLVARVMEGVSTPDLIVQPGASPHEYSLRPSEAAALQNADLVFWIGPDLTPWLAETIERSRPPHEHPQPWTARKKEEVPSHKAVSTPLLEREKRCDHTRQVSPLLLEGASTVRISAHVEPHELPRKGQRVREKRCDRTRQVSPLLVKGASTASVSTFIHELPRTRAAICNRGTT